MGNENLENKVETTKTTSENKEITQDLVNQLLVDQGMKEVDTPAINKKMEEVKIAAQETPEPAKKVENKESYEKFINSAEFASLTDKKFIKFLTKQPVATGSRLMMIDKLDQLNWKGNEVNLKDLEEQYTTLRATLREGKNIFQKMLISAPDFIIENGTVKLVSAEDADKEAGIKAGLSSSLG